MILMRMWAGTRDFGGAIVPPERRLAGIHGLRAFAALAIVLFHICWLSGQPFPAELSFVGRYFGMAVVLFFVVSAFSLAYSAELTGENIEEYAIKRFFRIGPLFYVMLVVYQLVFGFAGIEKNLANIFFIFGFVPGLHESIVWAGW